MMDLLFPLSVMLGMITLFITTSVILFKTSIHAGGPNEALVFSGRDRTRPDGSIVGFRAVVGERALGIAILEVVTRMDLRVMPITLSLDGAYSQGGMPLRVTAVATIKVSSDPLLLDNAVERFLGRVRDEVERVARETLEGHLRSAVAQHTAAQINAEETRFVETLARELEPDLAQLGLEVRTLRVCASPR